MWAFEWASVSAASHAVSVGELVDGSLHSRADRVAALPRRRLLLGADGSWTDTTEMRATDPPCGTQQGHRASRRGGNPVPRRSLHRCLVSVT